MPNWLPLPDLSRGLTLDTSPEEAGIGAATGGRNVRFRNGYAERRQGNRSLFTPAVAPYGLAHFTLNTTRFLVYPGLVKTYAWDGTTETEITNGNNTGTADNPWSCFSFNAIYVQNNGVDVPQYWTGDVLTNLVNLTNWDANERAAWMAPFKQYIFAGDITKSGTRYRQLLKTSALAEDPGIPPQSWDETDPTLEALEQPFAESNGSLVGGLTFGDDLFCIYKEDAIIYAQPADRVNVFRFGKFPGDTGLLAPKCVVEVPGVGHVFLTPGFDLVYHNGQGPQSIIDGNLRSWLNANINADKAKRAFLVKSTATSEVLACFPSGTNTTCDMAVVWNWKENKSWLCDLSNVTAGSTGQVTLANSDAWSAATGTWATDSAPWALVDYAPNSPRLILTRSTPDLSMFDSSSQDHGADFTASVEWGGMHFDAPERSKRIEGFRGRFDGAQGTVITVQAGCAGAPDGSVSWGLPVTHTIGTDAFIPASCDYGYYLWLKAYSTTGQSWRIRGAQVNVIVGGYF